MFRVEVTRPIAELPAAEPITAEIVPPAPSPWRFGLKALLGLMAVCSVQFAAMNYLGPLWGLLIGLAACFAAFSVIVLGGMVLQGERTKWLAQLDAIVVRLMLAIVVLLLGTILAGGGTAAYQVYVRLSMERAVEQNLGLGLAHVQIVHENRVVRALQITSITDGGVAHQAGLQTGEVIVVETTIDELIELLHASRGKEVDINVATAAAMNTALENCPQRSVTLPVP
jgi:hypothetical protein